MTVTITEHFSNHPAQIPSSSTGIYEFDKALNGGFPVGSVILVSGSSGSGKTIFSFQWLFEGVRKKENCLYITLTEPLFNTLKNLETMDFYNRRAIEDEQIKIIDMRDTCYDPKGFDYEEVLEYIEEEVKKNNASRLVIDSITAIAHTIDSKSHVRQFIFELGKTLATLGCTTFLTSEVADINQLSVYGVEEFISDVILRFDRKIIKDRVQRQINIVKVRGKDSHIGNLDFKITKEGIHVIPVTKIELIAPSTNERVSTGSTGVDRLLLGGVLKGSSTLLSGTTGTGKSLLSLGFLMDGLNRGEPCLYAGFEESHDQVVRNAEPFGWDLAAYEKQGILSMRCVYPGDMLLEEHLADIAKIVEAKGIKRCVIDSFSAISNSFDSEPFVKFAKRLNGFLKSKGVTSFFTMVSSRVMGESPLSGAQISSVTDNVIMMRHVEMEGQLQQVMNVVKIRGSGHSKELVEYDITNNGIEMGHSLSGFEGILTGVTRKVDKTIEEKLFLEFKRFLGTMAPLMFSKAKEKELTEPNLIAFIEDLAQQGVVKRDQANFFADNVREIFGPQAIGDGAMDDDSALKIIAEFFEDKDEQHKQNFMQKYFDKKK